MTDKLYTLEAARRTLSAQECGRQGHDYSIVLNGVGQPTMLLCDRCGDSWSVRPREMPK